MEGKPYQALADEEFEPFCKWRRGEDRDVLEIHLLDFKKEQLRVQITNGGILKVFGECPLEASKKYKFWKEFPLPRHDYETRAIEAKFAKGCLSITLPKRPKVPETDDLPRLVEAACKSSRTPKPQVFKALKDAGGSCRKGGPRVEKVAVTLAATVVTMAVLVACVVCICKTTIAEIDDVL